MHEEIIYDVVHPVSSALRTAASISLAKCPDIDSGYTLSKILGKCFWQNKSLDIWNYNAKIDVVAIHISNWKQITKLQH